MLFMMTKLNDRWRGAHRSAKPLRTKLDIGPGDLLELESVGERSHAPAVRGGRVGRGKGVWVVRAGQPLAASVTEGLLKDIRERRGLSSRSSLPSEKVRVRLSLTPPSRMSPPSRNVSHGLFRRVLRETTLVLRGLSACLPL